MTDFIVEQLKQLDAKIDKRADSLEKIITDALIGPSGGNEFPGLIVRVDRLERTEERRRWTLRAIAGAVLTLIGNRVYAFIQSHH